MIETQLICDFCLKPIPYDYDDWGSGPVRCVNLRYTKECDTKDMFPHLCESCAEKLDKVIVRYKSDMQKQSELAAKFAKANAKRREQLGTEG